jgi:hypothetical protein
MLELRAGNNKLEASLNSNRIEKNHPSKRVARGDEHILNSRGRRVEEGVFWGFKCVI